MSATWAPGYYVRRELQAQAKLLLLSWSAMRPGHDSTETSLKARSATITTRCGGSLGGVSACSQSIKPLWQQRRRRQTTSIQELMAACDTVAPPPVQLADDLQKESAPRQARQQAVVRHGLIRKACEQWRVPRRRRPQRLSHSTVCDSARFRVCSLRNA